MEQAKTTERCADRLRRNGFEVATAADAHEAGKYIRSRIAELAPASISFGDSMTLYATGTVEWLRTQRTYPFMPPSGVSAKRPPHAMRHVMRISTRRA